MNNLSPEERKSLEENLESLNNEMDAMRKKRIEKRKIFYLIKMKKIREKL